MKFESWYARIDPGAPFELLLEIFNQTQYLVMLPFCTMQLVSPLKRATTDISVATNSFWSCASSWVVLGMGIKTVLCRSTQPPAAVCSYSRPGSILILLLFFGPQAWRVVFEAPPPPPAAPLLSSPLPPCHHGKGTLSEIPSPKISQQHQSVKPLNRSCVCRIDPDVVKDRCGRYMTEIL